MLIQIETTRMGVDDGPGYKACSQFLAMLVRAQASNPNATVTVYILLKGRNRKTRFRAVAISPREDGSFEMTGYYEQNAVEFTWDPATRTGHLQDL